MIENIDNKKVYRKEIDGIRAFAVLAVIFYHLNEKALPSGFLGVDMFFVISGYVITSSLMRDKSINFFNFISNFYERRIRRIIPALIFFIVVFGISICFFNPFPGLSLLTGITSLFGVSNYFLIQRASDYFGAPNNLNVFTNTWSLGVEEQFYFFFPLFFWFSGISKKTKKGRNIFLIALSLISIISLIAFIYFYKNNTLIAYYSMPTRFWEISLGCLIFIIFNLKNKIIDSLKKINPSICLLLIFIIMILPLSFGGLSHVLVVLLTSLLLLCLSKNTFLYKVLTKKTLVHIGLISYSLYLWHWGIIVVSNWTIGIHWWSIPFQCLIIYILSLFSYKFVETPFRKMNHAIKVSKTFIVGLFSLVFSALSLVMLGKPLKGKLFLGSLQNFLNGEETFYYLNDDEKFCPPNLKKISGKRLRYAECFIDKTKTKNRTIFFLGDSHNLSLLAGAELVAKTIKTNLYFVFGHNTFPPIEDKENYPFKEFNKIKKDDILFITLRMPYYFINKSKNENVAQNLEAWTNEIQKLSKSLLKKNVSIIISTPTPEFFYGDVKKCKSQNPQWFNKLSRYECSQPLTYFSSEDGIYQQLIKNLKILSIQNKNLYLFDGLQAMCPNQKCEFSLNNKVLYWDSNHISHYGSKKLLAPAIIKFLEKENII